jgi:antitoxin HicB
LPEGLTFGEDRTDALVRAVDAIETALMAAMAAREEIAEPKASGSEHVTLPALTSAKVALYQAMRAEGVGKAELGRRLDVALPQIDRLLDLRHNSRLDAIERALAVLGRSMTIVVQAAA